MSLLGINNTSDLDKINQRIMFNASLRDKSTAISKFFHNRAISLLDNGHIFCQEAASNTDSALMLMGGETEGLAEVKEYVSKGIIDGYEGASMAIERMDMDGDEMGHNIDTSRVRFSQVSKIANLNIYIRKNTMYKIQSIVSFHLCQMRGPINFENVNIDFGAGTERKLAFNEDGFINFGGLTSNAAIIRQYTLNNFPQEFMQLFEAGTCQVRDTKKQEVVDMKVKDLAKAIAIINNDKRYKLLDFVLKLKKGAHLDQIFDFSGLSEIECFIIENNNIQLMFVKEGSSYSQPYSFSRYPEGKRAGDMNDMYQKTEDGWYVIWGKK